MLDIVDLLRFCGLPAQTRVKFIRHQDPRYDIRELLRAGLFEVYQQFQSKPVFDCDYIVSFLGESRSRARLIGVYRVAGKHPTGTKTLPPEFTLQMDVADAYCYDLIKEAGYEDLEERVVIEWGASTRSWHQWLSAREVVEILPKGYVREFPGYLDFVLTYDELRDIVNNPSANREWHMMLAGVAGVYLITDASTGMQYVGSAYGEAGILGRWITYVSTPHGGNDQLRDLLALNPAHARNFGFTILRTLPKTLTNKEVIAYEVLYKKKLGSRAFGLNSN
jgi:hypothetical protein